MMSESNHPESLAPDNLEYHPKSIEIYGEPNPSERFVEDIEENGVEQPITVTDVSHFTDGIAVISGNKRTYSAGKTNHDIPIGAWKEYDSPADEIAAVIRYNDYREKSFSQKMGEAGGLKEIEEATAEGRMQNPLQNFAEGDSGLSRDKIADRIKIGSGETYRKANKIWQASQDGNESAKELVDRLDSGDESIHSAYTLFNGVVDNDVADELERWAIRGVISPEQAQLLNSVWGEYWLFDLTIDHDLSVDELENVIEQLQRGEEVVSFIREWSMDVLTDLDLDLLDDLEEADTERGEMREINSNETSEALLWLDKYIDPFNMDMYEEKGWEPEPIAYFWDSQQVVRGARRIDMVYNWYDYDGNMDVEIQFFADGFEWDYRINGEE